MWQDFQVELNIKEHRGYIRPTHSNTPLQKMDSRDIFSRLFFKTEVPRYLLFGGILSALPQTTHAHLWVQTYNLYRENLVNVALNYNLSILEVNNT